MLAVSVCMICYTILLFAFIQFFFDVHLFLYLLCLLGIDKFNIILTCVIINCTIKPTRFSLIIKNEYETRKNLLAVLPMYWKGWACTCGRLAWRLVAEQGRGR